MHTITIFVLFIFAVKSSYSYLYNVPPRYHTIEYIQMNGFPAESHYVTTPDGYILNLHRIPRGRNGTSNGKVAYLEHGIWTNSFQWVISGPEKGLAFILADAGYDVWLANSRGNTYSRNHTTLNPDYDYQFWLFSWHEIGLYDLPASIDYILSVTNSSSLYYVAHSQGTSTMYVLTSLRPEYNDKIKYYVHMAPIAFVRNQAGAVFRILGCIQGAFPNIIESISGYELSSDNSALHQLTSVLCAQPIFTTICENFIFLAYGYSPTETNVSLVPSFSVHFPAGSSTKQLTHFLQEYLSGHFRQYDYGYYRNLRIYGRSTPPDYDLSKVTAPGFLFYARNDLITDYRIDIPHLYNSLGNCTGKYLVPIPSFNHIDYLIGIHAPTLIYSRIIDLLDNN